MRDRLDVGYQNGSAGRHQHRRVRRVLYVEELDGDSSDLASEGI